MLILGLTGGIGSGKSTAAEYFIERGFCHIDADQIGHELTAPNMPIIDVLNKNFGIGAPHNYNNIDILLYPGRLDRKAMAKVAFSSDENCELFDEIMFEAIIEEIEKRIREAIRSETEDYTGILIDAPLLFESGANELCDAVILIVADEDERITRVAMRDGATREEIRSRMDSQMDDELKLKMADYVIDNNGTVEELYESLDEIMGNLE